MGRFLLFETKLSAVVLAPYTTNYPYRLYKYIQHSRRLASLRRSISTSALDSLVLQVRHAARLGPGVSVDAVDTVLEESLSVIQSYVRFTDELRTAAAAPVTANTSAGEALARALDALGAPHEMGATSAHDWLARPSSASPQLRQLFVDPRVRSRGPARGQVGACAVVLEAAMGHTFPVTWALQITGTLYQLLQDGALDAPLLRAGARASLGGPDKMHQAFWYLVAESYCTFANAVSRYEASESSYQFAFGRWQRDARAWLELTLAPPTDDSAEVLTLTSTQSRPQVSMPKGFCGMPIDVLEQALAVPGSDASQPETVFSASARASSRNRY